VLPRNHEAFDCKPNRKTLSPQSTVGSSPSREAAVADAFTDSGTSPPSSQALLDMARTPIIPSQGQPTTGQIGGYKLARRRYQKGHLRLRGKREKVWVGRWLEDELQQQHCGADTRAKCSAQ
jgi:hypothetical protein